MPYVAVLPGDGIGPEIASAALVALQAVRPDIETIVCAFGGAALARGETAFPTATREVCDGAEAILFGAVGDARFDVLPAAERPESALLALRRQYDLYANVRPVRVMPGLASSSPLRPERLAGADFVVVRELAGGLYYGEPKRTYERDGLRAAVDTLAYDEREVSRIVRVAFEMARARRSHLTSVDKSNVLETSRLWRAVVDEIARSYPDICVAHMLVDTAAMQIVCNPSRFDVLVMENTFGDILSDEAAAVAGSIGVLPSASLGPAGNGVGGSFGLFEPIAGSAPDIAGTNRANPIGAMLSAAMLLEWSFNDRAGARRIESAIEEVLEAGFATADIATGARTVVGTAEFARLVQERAVEVRDIVHAE